MKIEQMVLICIVILEIKPGFLPFERSISENQMKS